MSGAGASGPLSRLAVAKGEGGKTLQDFLAARLGASRRAAKALIDARSVWVNRKAVWMAHHTLAVGDEVTLPAAAVSMRKAAAAAKPQERRHVRILLETPDYIVCDKPSGLLSNADGKSVETILREQTGIDTLEAVHRLDRDTTGCLLFAKTAAARAAAVEVFKTRNVKKTYFAIVAGRFPHRHFTVDSPLDGKPAATHLALQSSGDDASWLKASIETGRTNQIRRHLASIRFPILGDRTFGLKTARDSRLMTLPRQMLHSANLELPDPMARGSVIKAHSPLPADFRAALRIFGMGR